MSLWFLGYMHRSYNNLFEDYGITGYGVSRPGIQNKKGFCIKINLGSLHKLRLHLGVELGNVVKKNAKLTTVKLSIHSSKNTPKLYHIPENKQNTDCSVLKSETADHHFHFLEFSDFFRNLEFHGDLIKTSLKI